MAGPATCKSSQVAGEQALWRYKGTYVSVQNWCDKPKNLGQSRAM